ncbi:helix-turn-helix domain-containing protein [Burkholderia stagnalis]|uniref:helix-turn-helix domain-containing protein n=1 Tax=Burkholderia stagnalis TaxID=1503054 RepID=UPI000F59E72E|nr:helix-turn-helix domain-containing protein [Burkholderia stagnalis]RQQ19713.1 helix-turn-helix domain-containing protein [Burkholderia stagnalis]RQY67261.1 helix-turn-helix domain-containing protein [Burkholderia stagnalis]
MSIHLMNQAWRTDLPTGAKFVLVAVCDTANDEGVCWPSVETIRRKCSMGERTVQRHLDDLESAGIITRSFRKGRSTTYQVHEAKFPFSTPAKLAPRTTKNRKPNHQETRGAASPRVCVELPEWLDPKAWGRWEAHRVAVAAAGGAVWSQALAEVSLLTLAQRRTEGHDPAECINASILGNWSGIFPPRKVSSVGEAMAANVPDDWHEAMTGIVERGKQLGIQQKPDEHAGIGLERFKARVFRAAGPGKWQDDMLNRVTRESEERGAALLAFFTGVPRDGGAQQRAA